MSIWQSRMRARRESPRGMLCPVGSGACVHVVRARVECYVISAMCDTFEFHLDVGGTH